MRIRHICIVLVLLFAAAPVCAADIDHGPFHTLLKKHVKKGLLDYKAFVDCKDFKAYVALIGKTDPATLPNRNARLAFWINAYNALTINSVLPHWPGIKSVSNVYPKFAFFDRKVQVIGGKKYSLNQIENKIIRPKFDEPRIHAALNCASISCPPIQPFAFTEKGLNKQLNRAFASFANDSSRNKVDGKTGQVRISQIFNWYGKDFTKAGGPAKYLAKFVKDEKKKAALLGAKKVDFLKYNWMLNKL
jgi:hypothetical protein